ncbi:unnamed protein product [Menidia menidia]|uniref:(Atlantic silverside) hypothetical protein n=1 Tax=Menidia menidia TaxID=238744 RepID=A0A8S4ACI7_9TELE|nr:unnamed protein product [Menidia menidia]
MGAHKTSVLRSKEQLKSKGPVCCERAKALPRSASQPLHSPIPPETHRQPLIARLRWSAASRTLSQDE